MNLIEPSLQTYGGVGGFQARNRLRGLQRQEVAGPVQLQATFPKGLVHTAAWMQAEYA